MARRILFASVVLIAMAGFGSLAQTVHFETLSGPASVMDSDEGLFRIVVNDTTAGLGTILTDVLTLAPLALPGGTARTFDGETALDLYETSPGSNTYRSQWLTMVQLGDLTVPGAGWAVDDLTLEVFPGDVVETTYTSPITTDEYTATVCIRPTLDVEGVPYAGDLQDAVVVNDWGANEDPGVQENPTGLLIDGAAHGLVETGLDTGIFDAATLQVRNDYDRGDVIDVEYEWACEDAAQPALADVVIVGEAPVDRYNAGEVWQAEYDLVSEALNDPLLADGDIIRVRDGVYVDTTWDIEHSVTIESYARDASAVTIRFNAFTGAAGVGPDSFLPDVAIVADDITIQNLTLDFDGGDGTAWADHVRPGGGIITKDPDTGTVDGPQQNLSVLNNVIYVGDSTAAPLGPDQCTAFQNGVEGNPAGFLFSGNTVWALADGDYNAWGGNAGGIYINPPGVAAQVDLADRPMCISGNQFYGNLYHGVWVADAAYVEITGNLVDADGISNRGGIVVFVTGWYGYVTYDQTEVYVTENLVEGCTNGIWVKDDGGNDQDVSVVCNSLQDNEVGALLGPDAGGVFLTNTMTGNRTGVYWLGGAMPIEYNNYESNTDYGLVNALDNTPLDAEYCWWGDTSGPSGVPYTGTGDSVTSNLVDASPWLQAPVECGFDPGAAGPTGTVVLIGDVDIPEASIGGTFVSALNLPVPDGLADFQGSVQFDPTMFQVTDIQSVQADYSLVSFTPLVDANATGDLAFVLTNDTGAGYVTGDVDLLEIEFMAIGTVGDTCLLDLTVDVLRIPGVAGDLDIDHVVVDGRATIIEGPQVEGRGDVNLDGAVDITDARLAAEHAIGLIDLTIADPLWPAGAFARADVAPPFGVVDVTDARWIAEASIGLRVLSLGTLPTAFGPTSQLLTATFAISSFGELAINGTNAELADVQGTLYFDPNEVHITGVEGLNGFSVLASVIDNVNGTVKFAAAKLYGGLMCEGSIVEFDGIGDLSTAVLDVDVLRDAQGRDIPYDIVSSGQGTITTFGCTPNPVDDVHTTYFSVKGTLPIDQIRVSIYNFSGQLVYDSGWGENDLAWHLENDAGDVLANGIYYYRIEVLFIGAEESVTTGIGKVAVYR